MINEFIDKIVVHAPYWDEVDRFQQIDIYFNFIGQFELPKVEPTPEELAEMERLRQRRLRNKLYTRRYRERKRLKNLLLKRHWKNSRQRNRKNKNRLMKNQHNIDKLRRFAIYSRPSFIMQKFNFGGNKL